MTRIVNREDHQLTCLGEGRTHQSFKDECDINVTMKRWARGGQLTQLNKTVPQYGDFTNVVDYMDALLQIDQAEADFMRLPSAVRAACNNDPGQFIRMIYDPERIDELRDLGLLEEQLPAEHPDKKPDVPPETPPIQGGE